MNTQRLLAAFLVITGFLLCGNAWASQAGLVQFVHGDVTVTAVSGASHAAHKGDAINEGDTLVSARDASAQIKMNDGGFIAVRPNTRLKFDSFKFSKKQDKPESAFFSLFKGGFRAITGLIGRIRHEDYKITTPVATIGIRGTDHETVMVLPGDPLVLAGQAAPGAYNKVNVGETSITTNAGTVNVLPNQMGFAGGLNQMPQIQPVNTNLFTVVPSPSPNAKINGEGGDQGGNGGQATTSGSGQNGSSGDSGSDGSSEPMRDTAVVDTAPTTATASTTPTTTPGTTTTTIALTPPTVVVSPTTALSTATFTSPYIVYDIVTADVNLIGVGVGEGLPSDVITLPNPNVFVFDYGGYCVACYTGDVYTVTGGTPLSFSDATTGIQWGYWANPTQLTDTWYYVSTFGAPPTATTHTYPAPGVVPWIVAPAVSSPFYLPMVVQGNATYSLVGGVATDGANIGTIGSAQLGVNFTQQLVNFSLATTVGGVSWNLSGSGASLHGVGKVGGSSAFFFSSGRLASGDGLLTISASNNPNSPFGSVSGSLSGTSMTAAILSFSVNGTTNLAGVAALGLTSSTFNAATSYRIGLSSLDVTPPQVGASSWSVPITWDAVNAEANNAAVVNFNGSGNLTSWQTQGNPFANVWTAQSASISGGTAFDTGSDPVSGIQWGRWAGGNITFTPLAGGTGTTVPNTQFHWIVNPATSGAISLPVSGTYNYVLAGHTTPTDQLGNLGTLNSASLTANFSAMTVNVAASVSVPASAVTFNGSATGVPIQQGAYFDVGPTGAPAGTLTCSGTGCGASTDGHVMGVFTQSGLGAAVSYGFETGTAPGSPTTVVSGVAAFHR